MCLLVHFWKVLVSIGWIIHEIFHYYHCPSCKNSRFPTILKCILKSFLLESHFIGIMASQRDGGTMSLLCPVKPKHIHLSITRTSGTVIFVLSSLLVPFLLPPKHLPAPQDHVCILRDAKCTQQFPCLQTSELLDVMSWVDFGSWSILLLLTTAATAGVRMWAWALGSPWELPRTPWQEKDMAGAGTNVKRNHFCCLSLKHPMLCQEGTAWWHYTERNLKIQRWWSEKFPHHLIWGDTHHLNPPKPATTAREKNTF